MFQCLLPLFLALALLPAAMAQVTPAPTEKQLAALDKAAAPFRKKVTDVLEADKSGQYQRYLSDMKALAESSDPEEKKARAESIREAHYAFIKTAFANAKVDLAALSRQYAQILGHTKFTMDEFGGISSVTDIPKFEIPKSFDAELTCPYDIKDEFTNNVGIAHCTSSVPGCSMHVEADAYTLAGGCRSKASIGDKVQLPSGNFTKATVNAQFDFNYFGLALSLFGYGQYNVKIGLRLTGNNLDKVTIVHDAWCIAPLVFYNEISKDASNYPAQVTYTGSFSGAINPMVYCENFAITSDINSTGGFTYVNSIDFIKLDASN